MGARKRCQREAGTLPIPDERTVYSPGSRGGRRVARQATRGACLSAAYARRPDKARRAAATAAPNGAARGMAGADHARCRCLAPGSCGHSRRSRTIRAVAIAPASSSASPVPRCRPSRCLAAGRTSPPLVSERPRTAATPQADIAHHVASHTGPRATLPQYLVSPPETTHAPVPRQPKQTRVGHDVRSTGTTARPQSPDGVGRASRQPRHGPVPRTAAARGAGWLTGCQAVRGRPPRAVAPGG